ncbi:hypothetical protein B0H14DRAFT_3469023 [Mycena olivaceomarginata]|nr:hypothetical protein B0H14DRAFT_3469023 [Mycena olivaceomarginata]
MTTTPDIEILTLSLSKLRIMMPLKLVKPKNISGLELLDLNKRNYASWAESALDTFLYTGIRKYVMGEKASTQTSLLDNLLNIHIECSADMVDAAGRVRDISKQVFEVGPLDADKLSLAVLLRALSPELGAIRNKWEDVDAAKPGDIVKALEKETIRWEEEMKKNLEERANAAKSMPTKTSAAKKGLCGTCNGKHRTDECWGEGGAMKGRRDEVLERRAARCNKDAKQPENLQQLLTPLNLPPNLDSP